VSPRIVDLVAALATGAVGSVALARSDIADTLPGVAIAISLVPPLCVVGLTLESEAPHQALGALLLFTTNVVAILASGIVVMALYRAGRIADASIAPQFRRARAVTVIGLLIVLITIPLAINSSRTNATTVRTADVQAVAEHWANEAGWGVLAVTTVNKQVLIQVTGPAPAPAISLLHQDLKAAGLSDVDARVALIRAHYTTVSRPKQRSTASHAVTGPARISASARAGPPRRRGAPRDPARRAPPRGHRRPA